MNFLAWILFGLIVGIVSNAIDMDYNTSLIDSVLFSVVGAVLGGLSGAFIFNISQDFSLPAFVFAVCGSILYSLCNKFVK
jgi:uncharacterized membrane protein YeaQ/YmgE (transglycosylase-associated protein family)